MQIGNVTINGKLALAPMAGVTDLAFRHICREHGAALTVTEMVSAKALCYKDKKTPRLLELGADEHPAAARCGVGETLRRRAAADPARFRLFRPSSADLVALVPPVAGDLLRRRPGGAGGPGFPAGAVAARRGRRTVAGSAGARHLAELCVSALHSGTGSPGRRGPGAQAAGL